MTSKTLHRRQMGDWAEQEACRRLVQAGYQIVSCNFHSRYGEVDIIASKDSELIFAEVKARSQTQVARAIEVITVSKQRKIVQTALIFIQKNPDYADFYYRFDVFCFDFHQNIAKNLQQSMFEMTYDFAWIENAFTLNADLINL